MFAFTGRLQTPSVDKLVLLLVKAAERLEAKVKAVAFRVAVDSAAVDLVEVDSVAAATRAQAAVAIPAQAVEATQVQVVAAIPAQVAVAILERVLVTNRVIQALEAVAMATQAQAAVVMATQAQAAGTPERVLVPVVDFRVVAEQAVVLQPRTKKRKTHSKRHCVIPTSLRLLWQVWSPSSQRKKKQPTDQLLAVCLRHLQQPRQHQQQSRHQLRTQLV